MSFHLSHFNGCFFFCYISHVRKDQSFLMYDCITIIIIIIQWILLSSSPYRCVKRMFILYFNFKTSPSPVPPPYIIIQSLLCLVVSITGVSRHYVQPLLLSLQGYYYSLYCKNMPEIQSMWNQFTKGHQKSSARLSTEFHSSKLHPSLPDLHFSLLHIQITKPAAHFSAPLSEHQRRTVKY